MSYERRSWELIDGPNVPDLLLENAEIAEERIVIEAMHMMLDETTQPILRVAADRLAGQQLLSCVVLPDAFSRHYFDNEEARAQLPALEKMLKKLSDLGAAAFFGREYSDDLLGRTHAKALKELGRNHRKIYIADNISYCFGGCNFTHASFHEVDDYMLRSTDEYLAEILHSTSEQDSMSSEPTKNKIVELDDDNTVLLDGGGYADSLILDTVHELLADAEPRTMRFVSQYRPARTIEQALLGNQAPLIVFNPAHRVKGSLGLQQRFEELVPALPNICYPDRYVHAKFISMILKRNPDRAFVPGGGPVVLTGSHNFHMGGVMLGTKEIALLSSEEALYNDLNAWAQSKFQG